MKRQRLLIDNGSRKPEATLNLRRLAAELSQRLNESVEPVSLQHSNRITASKLNNQPARILHDYLQAIPAGSVDRFDLIPLFFGESRALTQFVPEVFADFPQFDYQIAPTLYPLPEGDTRLGEILIDHAVADRAADAIILVDHGSPLPAVTAVRNALFSQLTSALPAGIEARQGVMERREGRDYDFNGELLEDLLTDLAQSDVTVRVQLVLLFISPGRHAGEGGDIEEICRDAQQKHPNLLIEISPLVGDHPKLIDVLADRARSLSSD